MKRTAALAAATIAGLICLPLVPTTASAATSAATPVPPQLKVMPLGDSITAGYQSSTGNGYRGPLMQQVTQQSRYTVNFVGSMNSGTMADNANEGHSGYEIQGISNGIDGWLAAAHPDVVLLHLGINDLNNSDDDKTTAANRVEALIDRIFTDQPGVTVIMQGLIPTTPGIPANPAMQSLVANYNDQVSAWAPSELQAGKHFRFVDAPALTSQQMADGLHPNDAGYAQLAQNFYAPLDQAFTDGWVVGGPPAPPTTPRPARTTVGDFLGNGKLDVAGIDANNNMMLYTGDGAGHVSGGTPMLGTSGLWANFKAIAAGDFLGNGKVDIAGIDANNNMMLYTGDGAGHLSGGTPMLGTTGLWAGFKAITAGDFTGDGKMDIAGIDANNNLMLYTGDGNGHLSGGTPMLGTSGLWAGFKAITAGDFTGDGKMDIAGIDANNNLKLYTGDGAGHVSGGTDMLGSTGLWVGFHSVMAGDFNSDGKVDIAGIDANNNLKLYTGDGAGHVSGGTDMLGGNGLWAGF
ncbi:lysophospholipase L1-like esterase [Kitasatospora sp. MAP12-15]|uniref:FG-GAP-like repeat-containing protein n=1 Tax=unclassified Kitasatospora TaxID=2633591 RepID=UPI002474A5C9|nr:FG-GAP-like repeat-containing protein [Kitasatospora sp. MAP12-44]MDH6111679.1 lysophospholipase L1-like esterase [Kitasatospora sp. MAP12-44]